MRSVLKSFLLRGLDTAMQQNAAGARRGSSESARKILLAFALAAVASITLPDIAHAQIIGGLARQPNSEIVHTITGVFINYALIVDPKQDTVAERMTMWDTAAHADRIFSVAQDATIDGKPIRCGVANGSGAQSTLSEAVAYYHMCRRLPVNLVPGVTWLSLVWYPARYPGETDLRDGDDYDSTDQIYTVTVASPQFGSAGIGGDEQFAVTPRPSNSMLLRPIAGVFDRYDASSRTLVLWDAISKRTAVVSVAPGVSINGKKSLDPAASLEMLKRGESWISATVWSNGGANVYASDELSILAPTPFSLERRL